VDLTEWNWDDAKEVWQQEASAAALAKGRAEGHKEVFELLEKGYTVEQLKARLASGESAVDMET
jgi:SOS response regulatory protein OraA/RecX